MTFIVSRNPINESKRINDLFIKGEFLQDGPYILIFEGVLYPECKISKEKLLNKIIENGIEFISELIGYFCGIYYDLNDNILYFFTDKLGYYDLFYFLNEDKLILSNDFNELIWSSDFSLNDVDKESIMEFILFEYPLFDRTFIKNVKNVSIGTIFQYNLNENILEKNQYHDYIFRIDTNITIEKAINKLELLFDVALKKIKKLFPSDTIFGLGLSGGMDSRLIAYYASRYKMSFKTFIFGQENSDAYTIARKIAKLYNLDHYELGFQRDFYKYSERVINHNPMMNSLYAWYFANFNNLPKFEILLTGYNGDNQFGSHLNKNDIKINNNKEFAYAIIEKYCFLGNIKDILAFFKNKSYLSKIKEKIITFSEKSANLEFWQKKEEYNYKNRQRLFIKNNPSFTFLGKFDSISIFNDPDLLDFLMTIPFTYRLDRYLFYEFLRKKIPSLIKIRPERDFPIYFNNRVLKFIFKIIKILDYRFKTYFFFKKDHKPIHKWLSNYQNFIQYLNRTFFRENEVFFNIFNFTNIQKLISKKTWNAFEIELIFRFLTIKLFLDIYIKKKNDK